MKDKTAISKEDKDGQDKASEIQLGGDIALVGFEVLDQAETTIVKKIVGSYVRQMSNNGDYKGMRLTLHQHRHGKSFKHEVAGLATFQEGRFQSTVMDWNLYKVISEVCDKILEELKQKRRKESQNKIGKNEENDRGKTKKR